MTQDVQELSGGALRFAIGAPQEGQTYSQPEANLVNPGGAIRLVNGQPEGERIGAVTRHQTYVETGTPGASIMSTAQRTAAGISVELVPGSPASRTLVQNAVRDGLLSEVGPGVYVDTQQGQQQAGTGGQQGEPEGAEGGNTQDPGIGTFDPREDADWSADIEPLPQFAYDNAVTRTIDLAVKGGDREAIAQELAREAGIDPSLAGQYLAAGPDLYQRTADREMGKLGFVGEDLQGLYSWMRETKPAALRHSIQQFVLGRDVSALKKLAGEYQTERMRKRG